MLELVAGVEFRVIRVPVCHIFPKIFSQRSCVQSKPS